VHRSKRQRPRSIGRGVDYRLLELRRRGRLFIVLLTGAALAGLVLIGASLKLWRVTPAGFQPEVRISAIDKLQAWTLRRSAERAAAQGKPLEAALAWQNAIANDPANPELLRSALGQVARAENPDPRLAGDPVPKLSWLLRLTGTNRQDLELAARVYDRLRLPTEALRVLEPVAGELHPGEEAVYLKALFATGQVPEFAQRWPLAAPEVRTNVDLRLHHAAYLAGWGPADASAAGRQELESAARKRVTAVLATRLELAVHQHRLDVAAYAEALQRLEKTGAPSLTERIAYWRLLKASGRLEEAQALAQAYADPPALPWELLQLVDVHVALGLREPAFALLRRYAAGFGNAEAAWAWDLWVTYAGLLLEDRRWEELRALIDQLRTLERARAALDGFAHFLEGRALRAANAPTEAKVAFARSVAAGFPTAAIGFQAGLDLLRLGYPDMARQVLERWSQAKAQDPRLWLALCDVEKLLVTDCDRLVRAATRAYELLPDDERAEINYTTALLLSRQRPAEAALLSAQRLTRAPQSPGARINHCAALVQNQRWDEALALFQQIAPTPLGAWENTWFHLIRFELYAQLKLFDQAWAAHDRIQPEHLFPNQRTWLAERVARLPSRR